MRIIGQRVADVTPITYRDLIRLVSRGARTCYNSFDKAGTREAEEKFIQGLIKAGHESVIEPVTLSVEIVTSRSTQNQLVRHRHASFSVASQRYCNFATDKYGNEVEFIKPIGLKDEDTWEEAIAKAESSYMALIKSGNPPEVSRAVLPQCTATRMCMSANIREWRHIFKMRCDKTAQAEVRSLMRNVLNTFLFKYPCFFIDLRELGQ